MEKYFCLISEEYKTAIQAVNCNKYSLESGIPTCTETGICTILSEATKI